VNLSLKATSARYNDGGVVRRDYEKPQKSFESGFLYQKFCPRPLRPREVWLPDKSTKINNNFWMIIGRQLLTASKYYPDVDPMITWEKIKHRLKMFDWFDLPGYGFQYPRELLLIVAEVITRFYSSPDMYEYLDIFKRILDSVKVTKEGTVLYPSRGIGLGYYEDLKTLGVLAILEGNSIDLISLYGDQGLVGAGEFDGKYPRPRKFASKPTVISALSDFGFIINPKRGSLYQSVRWSGWSMSATALQRPKQLLEPLVSSFLSEFHWERKNILRSFAKDHEYVYRKYDKYIPFLYELFYGYEFYKGDSMANFENSGISSSTPPQLGNLRTWCVDKLISPQTTVCDDVFYETPFFSEWKRKEAKEFSLMRKNLYKNSVKGSTFIRDYATPKYELHRTRKPELSQIARSITDFTEAKLIINYGETTGRFTFGLNSEQRKFALNYCGSTKNPFETQATGGFHYLTEWRGNTASSKEWIELNELLSSSFDIVSQASVGYFDSLAVSTANDPLLDEFVTPFQKKRRYGEPSYVPPEPEAPVENDELIYEPMSSRKKPALRVTLSQLQQLSSHDTPIQEDVLKPVSGLMGDIELRKLPEPIEDTEVLYDDDIMNEYLTYCEDSE